MPIVSAVIPTRNRPDLVCRAVRSVLAQTTQDLECIVVIDGPDSQTVEALNAFNDQRLVVLALPQNVGGCEARNLGALAAKGEWIALLDDDDEWLPQRINRQLAVATSEVTMVASRFLDRGSDGDLLRPERFPQADQPISDFLWCEVSPFGGIVGFPQTSTWLVRRSFLLDVPFTKGLKCLQDLDWLLHAYGDPRLQVRFVDEPLTVFHNDHSRNRITKRIDWRHSYQWAMDNRALFTRKALGFFLVIFCVNPAAQQRVSQKELLCLLKDCRSYGKITPKLIFLYTLYSLAYPLVGRLLSPRLRSSILFRAKQFVR